MTQTQEHADAEQPSPWAPLHNPIYRNLFIASFVSNIGTWMQSVAAQWFLVEKHSSDTVVALVQTASLGPTLLFGLFAGVLADLFDRRRLLIVLQTYAVLVALALAVLTYLGRVGPTSLLMFTVAIGCASALAAPAWQAIQPEVVPREQIPAVSTLGSVSGNAARAIGPAIGGVILALAGPAAVFAINAISFAGIIVALLVWRRPKQIAPLEREHFGQAIVTGWHSLTTPRYFAGSSCTQRFSCSPPPPSWRCCRWSPPAGGTWEPVATAFRWRPSVWVPCSLSRLPGRYA